MFLAATSVIVVAVWAYLLIARGGFWLAGERDDKAASDALTSWPSVVAVIPARDEADVVPIGLAALLTQDYPGPLSVVLVDDQSSDGTAEAALATAGQVGAASRLRVVSGARLRPGWTGKLWAMRQGLQALDDAGEHPDFLLFTDADIRLGPQTLRRLASIARKRGSVLTSLMVLLRCESAAERWLTPAFVFFFQMLYPFPWVNDPARRMAGAAGGCMLVDREALNRAGGLESLRGALIDDCALGARMKSQGPLWLGLTEEAFSLRAYESLGDIAQMVSRSAYAQLRYSVGLLALTLVGLALVYLAPPLLAIFAHGWPRIAGIAAWSAMAIAFAPTLRLYRRPLLMAPALPAIAGVYALFTLHSAVQHWRGRGGYWKGRVQAQRGLEQA